MSIRYEKNEFGLMQDLMLAGLVSSESPTCRLHDPSATCQLYEKSVWNGDVLDGGAPAQFQ